MEFRDASVTGASQDTGRSSWPRRLSFALAFFLLVPFPACGEDPIRTEEYRVVGTLPHDTTAFTQGLLLHDGRLYESTGLYGESTLREMRPETGEVLRRVELDPELFGEGLARVGSRLVQLTWKEGRAFVYDLESFEVVDTLRYEGEGWGLCFDGASLFQSRGDATLIRRDPATFEVLETVEVTRDGEDVGQLNELECVGGDIYSNVYLTDRILRIDAGSGRVLQVFELSGIIPGSRRDAGFSGAMNGIAHDPATDTFLLTGKRWPTVFRVRLGEG